jgi:phage terminase large subunit-like protein
MNCVENLRAALTACARDEARGALVARLTQRELALLLDDWALWARPDQSPPAGDWTTWLMMGGRGAGKTRAGAEWVKAAALGRPPYFTAPVGRIALVGETHGDVRAVMVDGVSGLLALHRRGDRPAWSASRRRLEWPNGTVAEGFSSEDPEGLRGPQFALAWADEVAKWRHAEATWDMLQFALRLGERPRQIATTTPRPTALMRRILGEAGTTVTRASTYANAAHLSPAFLDRVVARYQGTRLGRQELDGDLIDDRPDALFRRDDIEHGRITAPPDCSRIVVAVDPPATSGPSSDACGIVAAGLGADGVAYVLADASASGLRPAQWAKRAIDLFKRLEADAIVVEVNQGGEMVTTILAEIDPAVPVRPVRASRGKFLRAEPVAALYEAGRVRHAGWFRDLEDEMTDFGAGGLTSGRSPDRLDALVWAVTVLLLDGGPAPRVRAV